MCTIGTVLCVLGCNYRNKEDSSVLMEQLCSHRNNINRPKDKIHNWNTQSKKHFMQKRFYRVDLNVFEGNLIVSKNQMLNIFIQQLSVLPTK